MWNVIILADWPSSILTGVTGHISVLVSEVIVQENLHIGVKNDQCVDFSQFVGKVVILDHLGTFKIPAG